MNNLKPQPNLDVASLWPRIEALEQALPSLDKLSEAYRNLLASLEEDGNFASCNLCARKEDCSGSCQHVETLLPGDNSGRSRRENLTGFHDSSLPRIIERRRLDVFQEYEACTHIFTDKQWLVISLHYRDGKTQKEIAKELGKALSTISGHLKEAHKRKNEHDRRLRAERIEILRKINHTEP